MKRPPKTGRASRLAGGLFVCSLSLGPPRPITTARNVTRKMSMNRNCRSPKVVCNWTNISTKHRGHCCEIFEQQNKSKSTGPIIQQSFGLWNKSRNRSHRQPFTDAILTFIGSGCLRVEILNSTE